MAEFATGDRVEWRDRGVLFHGKITRLLYDMEDERAALVDYATTHTTGRTVVSFSRLTPISAVDRLAGIAAQ